MGLRLFSRTFDVLRRASRGDGGLLLVGLGLLTAGLWWARVPTGVGTGSDMPRLVLPSLREPEHMVRLGGPADGPRVVDYFASACAACAATLPALQRVATASDVGWLSVSVDDLREDALGAVRAWDIHGDVAHDDAGRTAAILGVTRVPTVFVVAGSGRVVARLSGEIDEATFRAAIDRAKTAP